MNVDTAVARIRERLGNPSTTDIPDATIINRLNEAGSYVWDRFSFNVNKAVDTSITTVNGTASYNLATGTDIIYGVKDTTNNVKLKKIDKDKYDAKGTIVTGKPTEYFRYQNTIVLWTTPDAAYGIRVRYKPAFTDYASGGTISLPTSWHDGLVLLARFMHWDAVGDVAKAQYSWRMWKEWVGDKTGEISEELFSDFDTAVSVPTLEQAVSRLDFDHDD